MSIKPTRVIRGQLSLADLDAIISLRQQLPEGDVVVEVGLLYGLSSWLWSKNSPASARIVCIEPWKHEPWIDKARDQFSTSNLSVEAFRANILDKASYTTTWGTTRPKRGV